MKLSVGTGKSVVVETRDIECALDVERSLVCAPAIDRTKFDRAQLDAQKSRDGWYSFAAYRATRRAADEITGMMHVLSFDIDEGELPDFSGFSGIVLETATSSATARRWRVHLDLSDPITPARYAALVEAFGDAYGFTFDRQVKDPARLWYRRVHRVHQRLTGSGLAWKSLFAIEDVPVAERVDTSEAASPRALPLTPERKRELVGLVELIWPRSVCDMSKREDWIAAGMAIHASTGGDTWGLALWDTLSGRCPEKHNDGNDSCAHAWGTFKFTGAQVTLETLAGKVAVSPEEFPALPAEWKSTSSIEPEKTTWLWPGYLATGALHLLAGPPGVGKSQAALALAAAISTGGKWPDGTKAPRGTVILYSTEDDTSRTMIPRLIAAGGNRDNVYMLERREQLELMIKSLRPLMIMLDPITSDIREQNDQSRVREQLEPYGKLAREYGVTVLGLSHFAKRTSDLPVLERVLGSTSFTAIARVVMVMGEGDDGRVFAAVKNNLGPVGAPRRYTIEGVKIESDIDTSRIVWGAPMAVSAETALSKTRGDRAEQRSTAHRFILSSLEQGPQPAAELLEQWCDGEGQSERTLRRAKSELGEQVLAEQKGGKWYWRLANEQDIIESLLGVKQ